MSTPRVTADLTKLRRLCERLVTAEGYNTSDAAQIVDVLMYAELRGNNQGLVKIVEGAVAPSADAAERDVLRDAGPVLHLDAHQQNGMLVIADAAGHAVERARAHGIACVAVRNTAGSTGAIGYYVQKMAAAGVIGLMFGGTPKAVAPAGGVDAVLGTNPIAMGFPRKGHPPVVLDMATSAIAWFGLIAARDRGEAIPNDVAFDTDGKPTTDPAAALGGAIRAFAGNKGSGLALMTELLTGALAGGGIPGSPDANANRGTVLIAIDPAALATADLAQATEATLAAVKQTRPAPGNSGALLPGERGNQLSADQSGRDEIEIDQGLLDALHARADELGVR